MLAENPEILDIDVNQFANLVKAVTVPAKERSHLIILHQGGRLLKCFHSQKGMQDNFKFGGVGDLKKIKEEEDVDLVVAIERGVIRPLFAQAQGALYYDDDFVKQIFTILGVLVPEVGKGICLYPNLLSRLRYLKYPLLEGAFRLLIPNNSTLIFALFEGEEIFSSWILGFKEYNLSLITTSDSLVSLGLKIKDWRKDYPEMIELTAKRFLQPSLGIFMEVDAFRKIVKDPYYFLKALDLGEIIISPSFLRFRVLLWLAKVASRQKAQRQSTVDGQ